MQWRTLLNAILSNGDHAIYFQGYPGLSICVSDGREGNFQYNEHFWRQSDHFLVCIENVYPFEKIVLDGPGNSSRKLAQLGCVSPSEQRAELLSALFIPVSTKANVLNQGRSLHYFIAAKMPHPEIRKYVECYRSGRVLSSTAWCKLTFQWHDERGGMLALSSSVDVFYNQLSHMDCGSLRNSHATSHHMGEQLIWAVLGVDLISGYLSYFKLFLCVTWFHWNCQRAGRRVKTQKCICGGKWNVHV